MSSKPYLNIISILAVLHVSLSFLSYVLQTASLPVQCWLTWSFHDTWGLTQFLSKVRHHKIVLLSLSSSFFLHAVYFSWINQNLSGQNLSTPMLKIQNEHLERQFLQPKLSNRFSVRTETQLQPRDSVSVSVSKNSLQRMQNLHWNTDFGCSCATTCARGREVGREEERKKASKSWTNEDDERCAW